MMTTAADVVKLVFCIFAVASSAAALAFARGGKMKKKAKLLLAKKD